QRPEFMYKAWRRLLSVAVSLEGGCSLFGWRRRFGIFGFRDFSPLDFQQSIDCMLAVPQDRAHRTPTPIPGEDNLSQRDRFPSQFGANGTAQKPHTVKHANLA